MEHTTGLLPSTCARVRLRVVRVPIMFPLIIKHLDAHMVEFEKWLVEQHPIVFYFFVALAIFLMIWPVYKSISRDMQSADAKKTR